MKYLGQIVDDKDLVNKEYVDDATEVVQTLTSGTKIGSVGGTNLYAPTGGGGGGVQTTWYGTSSTTASTAEKVVTCEGFSLLAGAIIGIYFSTANTENVPTLNINSTGAKSIYVGNTGVSSSNILKWSISTILYFQYDGTHFRYITSMSSNGTQPVRGAGTWYGTCATAADATPKEVTCANFVPIPGSLITIRFTNGINRSASTSMTINGISLGNIERKWGGITSSNSLVCRNNSQLTFMWSGSYIELISVDDQEHPIGSCYTMSTNTDPATYFGGTWELIHKNFKSVWLNSGFTFNTTNTTDGSFAAILNGNTIEMRFAWSNKTAISDTSTAIGTLDKSAVGIDHPGGHTLYSVGYADGLNAIGMFSIDLTAESPVLNVGDWTTRATSYPTTTGSTCHLEFTFAIRSEYMLDSMCDEFIWKRIA